MRPQMDLLIKCAAAVIIMIAVHYISRTKNYYISGLVLSFPGLSILAYYFMYLEQGAAKVRATTCFAMFALIPFAIFLFVLNDTLKKNPILISISAAGTVWIIVSSVLVLAWNKINHI